MNGRSSASHLNNSPKFYRPSTLLLLLSKIRELGQSEDNREGGRPYSVLTPCRGEFAVEFCPRIIRAAEWPILRKSINTPRGGGIKQSRNRPISTIDNPLYRSPGLFFLFFPFLPFRFLIFGSRVERTKWNRTKSTTIFFFFLFSQNAAPLLIACRCIDACNTRG